MGSLTHRLTYSAVGATAGLTGVLALVRCGGECGSCFGCAAAGLAVVAAVLAQRFKKAGKAAMEGKGDGLA